VLLLAGNVDENAFLGAEQVEIEEFVEVRVERVEIIGIKSDVVAVGHGGFLPMKQVLRETGRPEGRPIEG
jgi:hypothetical protein